MDIRSTRVCACGHVGSYILCYSKQYSLTYSGFLIPLLIKGNQYIFPISLFQVRLSATYSILFAGILGFGIAVCLNSLYLHYFAWRVRVAQNSSPV